MVDLNQGLDRMLISSLLSVWVLDLMSGPQFREIKDCGFMHIVQGCKQGFCKGKMVEISSVLGVISSVLGVYWLILDPEEKPLVCYVGWIVFEDCIQHN